MTPSEHLDAILRAGKIPRIEQIVDVEHYKYVWDTHEDITVGNLRIPMIYGFLSDGATLVYDWNPEGFFAHDMLYARPKAFYKNVLKDLKKWKCDLIYSRIGLKHKNPIVIGRGLFLATGVNKIIWNKYRAMDQEKLIGGKIVPHAQCWEFRSNETRDAVWLG